MKQNYFFYFILVLLLIFGLFSTKATAQYCITNLGGSNTCDEPIEDVLITGTTLSNLNSGCTLSNFDAYSDFPASGNTTASLQIGQLYTVKVRAKLGFSISMWIDYDHNFQFDTQEWTQITTNASGNQTDSVQFFVPGSSIAGTTRMRIRTRVIGSPNGPADACTTYGSGETEDYTLTLTAGVACLVPPMGGITMCSEDSVCLGTNLYFYLAGNSLGIGQVAQWQWSADAIIWNDFPNATNYFFTDSVLSTNYYRCLLTCGGQSSASMPIHIVVRHFTQCYCSPSPSNVYSNIANFQLATLNVGIAPPTYFDSTITEFYSNYQNLPPTDLVTGVKYPVAVTITSHRGMAASVHVSVGIDLNHNSKFTDPGEKFYLGQLPQENSLGSNVLFATITLPGTALQGITGMRVFCQYSPVSSPCYPSGGEIEDYFVNIMSPSACTGPGTPVVIANYNEFCVGKKVHCYLSGLSFGTGQTYQWQRSPDNVSWTNLAGATDPVVADSVLAAAYYRCVVTCSGNQFLTSPIFINTRIPQACYCISGCPTPQFNIGWFEFGPFQTGADTSAYNNAASCYGYTDYTFLGAGSLSRGATYPIKAIKIENGNPTPSSKYLIVYIDFDQSGTYDPNEIVYRDTIYTNQPGPQSNVIQGSVTIPVNAPIGNTGMRVNMSNQNIQACGYFFDGETEDYVVYINYPLGLQKGNKDHFMDVVPNPAYDQITVSFHTAETEIASLQLFNYAGQLVYSEKVECIPGMQEKVIDIHHLAKGVYDLRIISDQFTDNRKLVIH